VAAARANAEKLEIDVRDIAGGFMAVKIDIGISKLSGRTLS
jgi:hypothetical protein